MSNLSTSNLLSLLKLFNGRPHHLAQFLLENDALNDSFLKKLNQSSKLSKFKIDDKSFVPKFNNIDEMKDYYNSFINEIEGSIKNKTKEEIELELSEKIRIAIESENYEEAARIRDYMIKNKLKKK
jgi:protein-arginine kinase activator protein McsA